MNQAAHIVQRQTRGDVAQLPHSKRFTRRCTGSMRTTITLNNNKPAPPEIRRLRRWRQRNVLALSSRFHPKGIGR